MNYADIKYCDVANGPGVRTTLFVSGCTHHCPECFNPEAWDFSYGKPFTEETENTIIKSLEPSYVKGLTLLGGEPFEPSNQKILAPFLKKIKDAYPSKDIWTFTGYTFEKDIVKDGRAHCDSTDEILSLIDVLVDGRFIQNQKNLGLVFRGSENQRIIDVKNTLANGIITYWEGMENIFKEKCGMETKI